MMSLRHLIATLLPRHVRPTSPRPLFDRFMILYYAMGGGLGHLTRARAFLHTLSLAAPVAVVSALPAAVVRRVCGDVRACCPPAALARDPAAYQVWLQDLLAHVRPRALYLDAFPAGLLGEFCDFPFPGGVRCYHLARLLRWPAYAERLTGEAPFFEKVYRLEPLAPSHEAFLAGRARVVEDLVLEDPPHALSPALEARLLALRRTGRPLWGVVHSGPPAEVRALLALAERLAVAEAVRPQAILVSPGATPSLGASAEPFDLYPAHPLFAHLDRLVTAGGFNAVRQAAPWRDRHVCHPFPRRFDDQHRRVADRGLRTAD